MVHDYPEFRLRRAHRMPGLGHGWGAIAIIFIVNMNRFGPHAPGLSLWSS